MSEQIYNMTEEFSVGMEQLQGQIKLAEYMVGRIICGNISDDKEMVNKYIDMLWAFLLGLVEVAQLRGKELDSILDAMRKAGAI